MRTNLVTLLCIGLLSLVEAQSVQDLIRELPSCALNCIFEYLPESSCAVTDIPCICGNAELWTNVTSCVVPSCSVKEALTAQRISADTCQLPVRDKRSQMEVTSPVLAAVALLMVIVRIIARRPGFSDTYGLDDTIIILAFLFGFPLAIIQNYLGRHGLGKDIWMVSFSDITQTLKLFYIAEIFYLATTVLTKISILFFYLRVFTTYKFRIVVWSVIAVCATFFIAFAFPLLFQCKPISYTWTKWDGEHEGQCIDVAAGVFSHAAINMALDLVVLILPLPLLYKLQLTYSVMGKIHIFVMFSFGLVVTIISALRLQTLVAFLDSQNPTFDLFGAALWSGLETFVGIICACLPAAKVFFFRIAPKWVGLSTFGSSGAPPANNGAGPRASRSWATSSRASSAHRLSKPPQRASAAISSIPEEDADFLPLQGKATPSVDSADSEAKRISWVVTGKMGLPLQGFKSPKRVNEVEIEEYDVEIGAASRREWPKT